jgi:hypothetical protein
MTSLPRLFRDVTHATDALLFGGGAQVEGPIPFTREAKEPLEPAGAEAVRRGSADRVGVERLLAALAAQPRVFATVGVSHAVMLEPALRHALR